MEALRLVSEGLDIAAADARCALRHLHAVAACCVQLRSHHTVTRHQRMLLGDSCRHDAAAANAP